jgi:hypothetical protein
MTRELHGGTSAPVVDSQGDQAWPSSLGSDPSPNQEPLMFSETTDAKLCPFLDSTCTFSGCKISRHVRAPGRLHSFEVI